MNVYTFKRTAFDSFLFAYLFSIILAVIVRPTEEQMLNLSFNASLFFSFLILGLFLSLILNKFEITTLGEAIFRAPNKKVNAISKVWYKTLNGWQVFLFVVLTFIVGFHVTNFSFYALLDKDSVIPAMNLFREITSPDWTVLPKAIEKMIETIFLAFMATGLAIPVAFILCFFCAKNIMKHPAAFVVYVVLRAIINICRSVEALVWAIIFSVWVGIGPFAGMLALMIHSCMSLAKLYSEIVESVNDGPIEGIQSTGANKLQTIWYAIVPQVTLPFISITVDRWDINIRMATIVGFVGGGGIGALLQMYQGQALWPQVGTIIVVIAFVVWFMDTVSAHLREALK